MDKEKINAYNREYRKGNLKYRESVKKWNGNNSDKMIIYRKRYNDSTMGRFKKLQLRAKRASIPIIIKSDEFVKWFEGQEFKCYYCKRDIVLNLSIQKLDSPCIDRKDNTLGYSLDNIALSCNRCNMAKGSWFTEEEMLEIAGKYLSGR